METFNDRLFNDSLIMMGVRYIWFSIFVSWFTPKSLTFATREKVCGVSSVSSSNLLKSIVNSFEKISNPSDCL